MRATADKPVFQHPRFMAQGLKVQVAGIDRRAHEVSQHALQVGLIETARCEQLAFSLLECPAHSASMLRKSSGSFG